MQPPRVVRHEVVQPLDQSIKLIPLTRGQTAIVDATDYDWLNQWDWFALWTQDTRSFRAGRSEQREKGKRILLMHMAITGFAQTDHRNHNTLDNRRENLRDCTRSQNTANSRKSMRNTSGSKGVSWSKFHRKWGARIKFNYKQIHLGYFTSLEDAARAYDAAAKQHFGEFAHTNF